MCQGNVAGCLPYGFCVLGVCLGYTLTCAEGTSPFEAFRSLQDLVSVIGLA